MTTNYDPIAENYQRAKLHPWRRFIECFTLLELIGDVHGLDVLDVACGEGFYTRLIRQRGAARVIGVDNSKGMLELAVRQESECPLGIEYLLADARSLDLEQEFDLAVAAYLLNYAHTPAELQTMCEGIAERLRPGGRFINLNSNPCLDLTVAPSYRKYGFETRVSGDWQEGTPLQFIFYLDDGPIEVENYHLDPSTYEAALRSAGFREIYWRPPKLSPEALEENSREYWDDFMDYPPVTFMECVK